MLMEQMWQILRHFFSPEMKICCLRIIKLLQNQVKQNGDLLISAFRNPAALAAINE